MKQYRIKRNWYFALLLVFMCLLQSCSIAKMIGVFKATKAGEYEKVKDYVESGYNVNTDSPEGATLLLVAAAEGHLKLVQYLLDQGAYPNSKVLTTFEADGKTVYAGLTPLMAASFNGHLDVVELLLANKANPKLRDKNGNAALSGAAYKGHTKIVEKLISSGANVDNQTYEKYIFEDYIIYPGNSALLAASANGKSDVVGVLLKNGANPDISGAIGATPLLAASGNGYLEVAKLLVENGANVNAKTLKPFKVKVTDQFEVPAGSTPLTSAVFNDFHKIVEFLLNNKVEVNAVENSFGNSALHIAIMKQNLQIAKLLIENGGDVSLKNYDGDTPFSLAKKSGNQQLIQLFTN